MPVDTMIAWAAGFLDGEGYFAATRRSKNPANYYPSVVAYQTNREPLARLQELFGGMIYEVPKQPNRRQAWRWSLQSSPALREMLPKIIPFLTTKRDEAEILLELAEKIGPRGRYANMAGRIEIADRLKERRAA